MFPRCYATSEKESDRKIKSKREKIKASGTSPFFFYFKQKRKSLFHNLNFYTVAALCGQGCGGTHTHSEGRKCSSCAVKAGRGGEARRGRDGAVTKKQNKNKEHLRKQTRQSQNKTTGIPKYP